MSSFRDRLERMKVLPFSVTDIGTPGASPAMNLDRGDFAALAMAGQTKALGSLLLLRYLVDCNESHRLLCATLDVLYELFAEPAQGSSARADAVIELGEAVKAIRAHLDVIDSHTVNSGAPPREEMH